MGLRQGMRRNYRLPPKRDEATGPWRGKKTHGGVERVGRKEKRWSKTAGVIGSWAASP